MTSISADTRMGKTLMQLAWAQEVTRQTGNQVLVLETLAEKDHTINAGQFYGIVLDESSIFKGGDV